MLDEIEIWSNIYRIKHLAMHDVGTVDGPSRPSDVQGLAIRMIKFHIPYPFPFLKYVQIILKRCNTPLSMYRQIYTIIVCRQTNMRLQTVGQVIDIQ